MKILIAEDDPHILDGLCLLLEGEGYVVLRAADGSAAWEAFKKQKPDFVLLDIMMPGKSGYDVCREIRKEDGRIPILFLSAKSEEIDRVVGLELGADDFISKPFGARELMARIRAVSRRLLGEKPASEQRSVSFQMGQLVVFPSELRARRGEATIDLSLRDIAILELLYRRKGQVVSRNEMFDVAWGLSYSGNTRALDQHISQLRKKIEENPLEPRLIQTVHGAGYRYEEAVSRD